MLSYCDVTSDGPHHDWIAVIAVRFHKPGNSSVSTREPSAAGSCPAPRAAAHPCPDTDVGDIQGIGCARVCSLQFARLDARGITFARFHPDPPRSTPKERCVDNVEP